MSLLRITSALVALTWSAVMATQQTSVLLARLNVDGAIAAQGAKDEALEAVQVLDGNKDGQITFDEVATFAKTKGLNYASTLNEFAKFDEDQNGMLNVEELAKALGLSAAETELAKAHEGFASDQGHELKLASNSPAVASAASVAATSSPSASAFSERDRLQRVNQRVASLSDVTNAFDVASRMEAEAQEQDERAAEFRAQAKRVALDATQRAMQAASTAARAKAEEFSKALKELEEQAMVEEVHASATKAKADAEEKEADDIIALEEEGLDFGKNQ